MDNGHRLAAITYGTLVAPSKRTNAPPSDFWPEVCRVDSWENAVQMKPENSQRRVSFEVFFILGLAGLMAVVAAIWIPIMS
jgi:hypothetical protein